MKEYRWRIVFALLLAVLTLATTVMDASATLIVRAMPNGVTSKLTPWDSGPYTWPGNNLELWGNVTYTGAGALTYTWDFGAGEGATSGTVTNGNNIVANHAYASGGSYIAKLTVTDGTETDSATVDIDVLPLTLEFQKNLAVQRGLKYLYMTKTGYTVNNCAAYYWDAEGRWFAITNLAVLAFEDYGHRETNDATVDNSDIYAYVVKMGLRMITAYLATESAGNDPANGQYDLNNDLLRVYSTGTGSRSLYETGILAMTIANTATPAVVVGSCGSAAIRGMTYKQVLEDVIDWLAYAQEIRPGCHVGGWRYGERYCSSDNSVSQWPALGMSSAAKAPFAVAIPAMVKTRLASWIASSQGVSGGFDYYPGYNWFNIAKTGAGLAQMTFTGNGNLANALGFMNLHWNDNDGNPYSDYSNRSDHYSMYAAKKGLQAAGITNVGAHNWQQEYNQWYVNNQVNAGTSGVYWPASQRIGSSITTTAFSLLVMAPGLTELPPVSVAGADQQVPPLAPVTFNGSSSYHTDPAKHIVKYEWDFNYDGVTFNINATGPIVTKSPGYTLSGVPSKQYTVALKVTDDSSPALTSFSTLIVTVSVNDQAPVANPGGPYLGAAGLPITFDGSLSHDANVSGGANPICPGGAVTPSGCDEIVRYEWNIDGNILLGKTVNYTFGSTGTRNVSLKVTDSFGASAAQSVNATTVAVSDLYLVSYVPTVDSYNRVTKRWTKGWKVGIRNRGNGDATGVTGVLTGASIPPNVTVMDGKVTWGTVPFGTTVLSGDDFQISFPLGTNPPDLSKITWDVQFTDGLGTQHVIRNLPQ